MKALSVLAIAFAVIGFSGCATTPQNHVTLTSDGLVDGPKLIAEGPPPDLA